MPAKGQKTGYYIDCEFCGKTVYQTKTQYNKAQHHFCSNDCQMKFQKNIKYENRECECCGKNMYVLKTSHQKFCSVECQHKWQETITGKLNPKFTQIEISCETCGKFYYVKKYKTKCGQHNFCSDDCRKQWYSNVWSQDKDWKEESRIRAAKILSEGKMPFTNSKPQLVINKLLDSLSIPYENEYNCKYYTIDNYLSDNNLMIEVMGDFWHCNPIVFNIINQDVQLKRIPKDKAKHTYIKNKYGIEILYLWESDIINNMDLCQSLILKYINSNGILENYHSFNYHIKNDDILINKPIIIPYQDMSQEELSKYKVA